MTPEIDSEAVSGTPIFSFSSLVLGSGYLGLLGWIALLVVVVSAVVVVLRHVRHPERHSRGTAFFGIAHVCLLLFVNNVGVFGLMASLYCGCVSFALPASQVLVSLASGLGIVGVSSVVVAVALQQFPKASAWDCFGMGAIVMSLCVLFGGLLAITLE